MEFKYDEQEPYDEDELLPMPGCNTPPELRVAYRQFPLGVSEAEDNLLDLAEEGPCTLDYASMVQATFQPEVSSSAAPPPPLPDKPRDLPHRLLGRVTFCDEFGLSLESGSNSERLPETFVSEHVCEDDSTIAGARSSRVSGTNHTKPLDQEEDDTLEAFCSYGSGAKNDVEPKDTGRFRSLSGEIGGCNGYQSANVVATNSSSRTWGTSWSPKYPTQRQLTREMDKLFWEHENTHGKKCAPADFSSRDTARRASVSKQATVRKAMAARKSSTSSSFLSLEGQERMVETVDPMTQSSSSLLRTTQSSSTPTLRQLALKKRRPDPAKIVAEDGSFRLRGVAAVSDVQRYMQGVQAHTKQNWEIRGAYKNMRAEQHSAVIMKTWSALHSWSASEKPFDTWYAGQNRKACSSGHKS